MKHVDIDKVDIRTMPPDKVVYTCSVCGGSAFQVRYVYGKYKLLHWKCELCNAEYHKQVMWHSYNLTYAEKLGEPPFGGAGIA